MAAATHARIYFAAGGGADTLDVQETVGQLVPPPGCPMCWVTDAQGNRVWVNIARIVRIEAK